MIKGFILVILLFGFQSFLLSQNKTSPVISIIPTGAKTLHDYQSNASPMQIAFDQERGYVHSVYMATSYSDTNFSGMQTVYFFSSDEGITWSYIANLTPILTRYPSITVSSEGNALIGVHSQIGGNLRVQFFYDAYPGLGSLLLLQPALIPSYQTMYPRFVFTENVSNPVKFVFICSNGSDTAFRNYSTSLTSDIFGQWAGMGAKGKENYAIGRGSNGIIGIAYIKKSLSNLNEFGDVFYMQSNDNGITFGYPVKIFDANLSGDGLGGFQGISIVFIKKSPNVVFDVVKYNQQGEYSPLLPSQIRFWSSEFVGTDPNRSAIIADSSNVPFYPYIGVNDNCAPVCKPVIGAIENYNISVAFTATSNQTGGNSIPTTFKNIYFISEEGVIPLEKGSETITPIRINPISPRLDWSDVSISPNNGYDNSYHYSYLTATSDTIPGSFVNGRQNGKSYASQKFIKVKLFKPEQNLSAPTLISPPNGAINVLYNPLLVWSGASGSHLYTIQLSTSEIFSSSLIYVENHSATSYQISSNLLGTNEKYYWRVKYTGSNVWSEVFSFRTFPSAITKTENEIPEKYELFQNYPNPFNSSTIFKFSIPVSGDVSIDVFDIKGKKITSLINQRLESGNYKINADFETLSSGVYFYRINVNDYSEARKFVLLR